MTTTRFCLIRHGETFWNTERRLQGHTDIPLNARGQLQAQQLALSLKKAHLKFDVLYTSDLKRASDTAAAIAAVFDVPMSADHDLRERHFGVLQGITIDEAPSKQPHVWQAHLAREQDHELEGGESISQLAFRVKSVLEKIGQKHSGQTILIVSHGGTMDMMYRIASKQSLNSAREVSVPNASLSWITHNAFGWAVERWGDTSHLEGPALENVDL
ncbi:histidine phosphatase family protein [Polynucleobacter brandtiae]|uniref:Phosphoglycerate mutase n=1 Tax=Polynucleobacter brandtiae TaxID=1938816 RepID=A0A2M8VQQ0_9BURK|nr:histidine phosphatase family protein [Polynucleobacter brandtiae]PJI79494.1 phosphoglycerate mutase [Polynucleobacter brandtiae]